jgi:hypothetical protein
MSLINGFYRKVDMLRQTKELLKLLNDTFPIESGRHHGVLLENDSIMLMIHLGPKWRTFILSEEDLDMEPKEIVTEIQNIISATREI